MGSVLKQEDTEKSNEHLVTLNTLSCTSQASTTSTEVDIADINNEKVSISDMRTKFLNTIGDEVTSTSNNSDIKNDLQEPEHYSETTGRQHNLFYILYFQNKLSYVFSF